MQEKRLRKYNNLAREIQDLELVKVFGDKNSEKAIIIFGSNKGISIELGKELGLRVIQPLVFQPFPEEQMKEALLGVKKIFTIETNTTAQLAQFLSCRGIKVDGSILKYTGRPFFIEELRKELNEKIK
jgi:2-oxoglutarate ferredoxin oxidoreductase subunit alpha